MDEEITWADQHEAEPTEAETVETETPGAATPEADEQTEATPEDTEETPEADADTNPENSDAEGSEEGEKTEKRAGKKKRTLSDRFRQLSNQRKAAEDVAAQERQRALRLETKLREMSQEVTPKTLEDFSGDEQAFAAYERRMDIEEVLKTDRKGQLVEQAQEARQAAAQAVQAAWFSKVDAYAEEMPDYNESLVASGLQVPPDVVRYAMESEYGPRMLYVLSKNPAKAQQLFSLPSSQRLRQTVNLENACLSGLPGTTPAQAAAPRGQSQAQAQNVQPKKPKPNTAPSGGSSGGGNSYSKSMSMEAYAAMRNKQLGH